MSIIRTITNIVIDALFPLSPAEKELFRLSPEDAWNALPGAPRPPMAGAYSIFAYKNDLVTRLVWSIKYAKSAKAVAIGGYAFHRMLMGLCAQQPSARKGSMSPFSGGRLLCYIVPMPITARRRRERGFNQCELLVDEIAQLDTERRFIVEKGLLARIHHASRQTLKDRKDRLASAKGIFAADEEVAQKILNSTGEHDICIIIIDDVITTGSTMNEAVGTIKTAGFPNVLGLSLAH